MKVIINHGNIFCHPLTVMMYAALVESYQAGPQHSILSSYITLHFFASGLLLKHTGL
jgi:hypothetical protein